MQSRVLVLLRRFFNLGGWFLLAAVVVSTAITVGYHFTLDPTQTEPDLTSSVPLAGRLGMLFDGIGNAYFAFFMGAILLMLQLRRPTPVERAERFLLITCGSFICKAVTIAIDWSASFPGFDSAFTLFSYMLSATIAVITPLIYAATMYVLFSQLTQMVTFESEVA